MSVIDIMLLTHTLTLTLSTLASSLSCSTVRLMLLRFEFDVMLSRAQKRKYKVQCVWWSQDVSCVYELQSQILEGLVWAWSRPWVELWAWLRTLGWVRPVTGCAIGEHQYKMFIYCSIFWELYNCSFSVFVIIILLFDSFFCTKYKSNKNK